MPPEDADSGATGHADSGAAGHADSGAAGHADSGAAGRGGRATTPLRRVVNATGVVLHADLGRSPLSAAAREAVAAAAGYTTLEYDLASGGRGSRTDHLGSLAAELCGTEAATAVTNGAAAVVLSLAALAHDREVIVGRGELLELGGTYRLTDAAAAAGCQLVEVGSTNRTRLEDYRSAVGRDTAVLLKVHRAGYTLAGSTEDVAVDALVHLGRETGVPVLHVVGSGLIHAAVEGPLAAEPSLEASVAAGTDLVVFSADKLLGGPQAGIVTGRADLILRIGHHPLARAVQVDKLQRAALEATLEAHLRDDVPLDVPTVAMLAADPEVLHDRARWMAEQLDDAEVVPVTSIVGSGAAPGGGLPSWAVRLTGAGTALAAQLRAGDPPVIARVDDAAVLLDLRTVPPSQDPDLVDLVLTALGR